MSVPDVLIAGGGPVGLTLAIELGQLGVSCELVDKRPGPGRLPKMERCNARTMEHFRRMGIASRVRAAGLPADVPMDVFICVGDLTRPPLVHHAYPSVRAWQEAGRRVNDGSLPLEPYQLISQYTLEPLLRQIAAATPGVTVKFGQELTSFTQNGDGITARVRPTGATGGPETTVSASYLVGCDGAGSTVRGALGIELRGDSLLTLRQALFHCPDLFARIPIGPGRHYHFADEQSSFLIVQDDTRHFSLHAKADTDAEMAPLFESLAGMPVLYETLYVGQWTQRLMLAERYRDRRVFLAGDAAHLVIPTGGLGMNTGVGDAVDLAWKLAGTLHGWGGPRLLDSYETERRAIGARNVAASRKASTGRRRWREAWRPEIAEDTEAGARARAGLAEIADREQRWSNDLLGIELGYRYQDSPLIAVEDGAGPDPDSFTYAPTTWPGTRLPHVWLDDGTAIQDKLGRCFTLLRAPGSDAAAAELGEAFDRIGAPFASFELRSAAAESVYEGHRLILVRPDLHVVWRGDRIANPAALAALAAGHGTPVLLWRGGGVGGNGITCDHVRGDHLSRGPPPDPRLAEDEHARHGRCRRDRDKQHAVVHHGDQRRADPDRRGLGNRQRQPEHAEYPAHHLRRRPPLERGDRGHVQPGADESDDDHGGEDRDDVRHGQHQHGHGYAGESHGEQQRLRRALEQRRGDQAAEDRPNALHRGKHADERRAVVQADGDDGETNGLGEADREERERERDQDRPQYRLAPDEPEPDCHPATAARGAAVAGVTDPVIRSGCLRSGCLRSRRHPEHEQRHDGHQERCRVDLRDHRAADDSEQPGADQRRDQAEALVERLLRPVGVGEQILRYEFGHKRTLRRADRRPDHAVQEDHHVDDPDVAAPVD
jgi:2-polyprenyl-6-methoxyphenol hydroxylase-like FAD-dependent oxidoreductase